VPENKNEEKFDRNEIVYCIDQSAYEIHVTKRKIYKVEQVGIDSKLGKVRIKGNQNRLVWLPELLFSKRNQPKIVSINIDDKISDPKNDCVEITVTFEDDKKYWLRALTPNYLITILPKSDSCYFDQNALFLNQISKEFINKAITELDNSNELNKLLLPYN